SRWLSTASLSSPSSTTTGTRSAIPSTAQNACASTDSRIAGASSRNKNTCSSSMFDPSQGNDRTIAGPPVSNTNSAGCTALPSAAVSPRLDTNRHLNPAGRSSSKSYTQLRASAQRPLPGAAQCTSNGSSSRGSPSATIG